MAGAAPANQGYSDFSMQPPPAAPYFEQPAPVHPYRQEHFMPQQHAYGMPQSDHVHFSGVPVADAGNYTASRYSFSPYQSAGGYMPGGARQGGRPGPTPGNDGFDIALMSQQSTFLVDYTRPMLVRKPLI